jgi:hypothetical protein
MYIIMCVFRYTCSQKHNKCQMVSLCKKQHYVIYTNYIFRPCKRAIIRLFTEPASRLHNRSLGGETRSHFAKRSWTNPCEKRGTTLVNNSIVGVLIQKVAVVSRTAPPDEQHFRTNCVRCCAVYFCECLLKVRRYSTVFGLYDSG